MHLAHQVKWLKESEAWQEFRQDIIEKRIEQLKSMLMTPVKGMEDVFEQERAKGAIIGLTGLLVLFDSNIPEPKEPEADENSDES